MQKKYLKKILAFVMCFVLLFNTIPLASYADEEDYSSNSLEENRQKLQDLQGQSNKLAAERKEIQAQINSAKNQKEQQQLIKESLNVKIDNTVAQITVLDQKIIVLKEEINLTEKHIEELQDTISENFELFLQRVRASYMYGDIQPMSVVLGADNYYDSLVAAKTIESVAEHDNQLIESLNEDKKEVEEALAQLEEDKKDLENSIAQMEDEKKLLEADLEATNVEIENFSKMEQEFKADLAANQKMSAELQSEMNAVYAQIQSQGQYVGGTMTWPVPGFGTISSYYGWRWGKTDYHTGVDITGSGVNGKNIVAANSGTVAKVNTTFVPNKGYGIYVIIDHGGGTTTLYGHCSALLVSEGQKVTKGTPIAKVGSTGWSTGPHLHFEVRENGNHTNPLQAKYLGTKS